MDKLLPIDILLVEDNDADAEITLRSFRKAKLKNTLFRVREGVEALEFVLREGAFRGRADYLPKLIVLDLNMPTLSGMEVLRRLKSEPRTATIPVILLTASLIRDDIAQAKQLGALNTLTKPVDFAQFAQAGANAGLSWIDIDTTVP